MTSALDTSVLVDVLARDPVHEATSRLALERASEQGALLVSPIVVAELRAAYESDDHLSSLLLDLGLHLAPLGREESLIAGAIHRRYRLAGGSRKRVVADFLIAAHAQVHADRLIARDRGFFRAHFEELVVWYPDSTA